MRLCKVVDLLPPWCLTKLPDELHEQIFDLLDIDGIDSICQADPKLSTLVHETRLYKKKLDEFYMAWNDTWDEDWNWVI
jgi:hypothetical protein